MNDSQIDPRAAWALRLQDMWKRTPTADDEADDGSMSASAHNDGHESDDARGDYCRALTANGVPHFGDKQMNAVRNENRLRVSDGGGVVRFSDRADLPAGPTIQTNLTVGQVLRLHRDQRQRERLGGAV